MIPASLQLAHTLMDSAKFESFTFDVFDTFLLRRTTRPEGVYERAFFHAPIEHSRYMAESFVQHRELAERKARQKNDKDKGISETTIDEIYTEFPLRLFGLHDSARSRLVEAEWLAEKELCILNPDIYTLLVKAGQRGLKTGFLSDTYWSASRIRELLLGVAPDLTFDFLYPSCEYGVNKASGLFTHYLKNEQISPIRAAHMGDNPMADVKVPSALGIRTVHYPQFVEELGDIFERESGAFRLIQGQRDGLSSRLDKGLTLVRRKVAAALKEPETTSVITGAGVLGPLMTAFHHYTQQRVEELSGTKKKLVLLFLARDGHLPMQLWERSGQVNAHYVGINRHITTLGYADNIDALQEYFSTFNMLGDDSIHRFLSISNLHLPSIKSFFRKRKNKIISGKEFARILPSLVTQKEMDALSSEARKTLMAYLRHNVPELDACTDIVLVDLGYTGTIQRALRQCFDKEGLGDKNLHGVYLACVDDKFSGIRATDSASGLIDTAILTPATHLSMLRNVPILEMLCSADIGSVMGYEGGNIIHENDPRPRSQMEYCGEVQAACIRYFEQQQETTQYLRIKPFADPDVVRAWSAAILVRFLLMPTAAEQQAFGHFCQDINLGMDTMDLVSVSEINALLGSMEFPVTCALSNRPPWIAASMNMLSPLAGYSYVMNVFGLCKGKTLADKPLGQVAVKLIKPGTGVGQTIAGNANTTALGDVRVRIPVLKRDTDSVLALPLEGLFTQGLLRSVMLQEGEDVPTTLGSQTLKSVAIHKARYLQTQHHGAYFCATGQDSYLLIDAPLTFRPLLIVTVTITPLPQSAQ